MQPKHEEQPAKPAATARCPECLQSVVTLAYPLVHSDGLERLGWHTRAATSARAAAFAPVRVTCPGSWKVAVPVYVPGAVKP